MSIRTVLTEKFGLQYPIVSAPMGSVAGGRLAAAVSNAGALGLVGGGYGDPDWLRVELSTARSGSTHPWGVGLISWHATHEIVELALTTSRTLSCFLSVIRVRLSLPSRRQVAR